MRRQQASTSGRANDPSLLVGMVLNVAQNQRRPAGQFSRASVRSRHSRSSWRSAASFGERLRASTQRGSSPAVSGCGVSEVVAEQHWLLHDLRCFEHTATIPVLRLVSDDHVSTQQARALACDVYVYKPFDPEELLSQVTMLAGVPAPTNQRESPNGGAARKGFKALRSCVGI